MTHAPNPAECPGAEPFPAHKHGLEERIMLGAGIVAVSAVLFTATMPAPHQSPSRHVAYVVSAAPHSHCQRETIKTRNGSDTLIRCERHAGDWDVYTFTSIRVVRVKVRP